MELSSFEETMGFGVIFEPNVHDRRSVTPADENRCFRTSHRAERMLYVVPGICWGTIEKEDVEDAGLISKRCI
jgi:hypothetical protein